MPIDHFEVRSYAAPLGHGEFEIVCSGTSKECRAYWGKHFVGTTAVLDHAIVAVDETGSARSLDDLTDQELTEHFP